MDNAESRLTLQETMMEKYQDEDVHEDRGFVTTMDQGRRHRSRYQSVIIIVLLSINVVQAIFLLRAWPTQNTEAMESAGRHDSQLQLPQNIERLGSIYTKYMSTNETEARHAWENIEAGHGMIALTIDSIKAQHLPPSLEHFSLPGKMIYGIEGYHAIHCLKTIRRHYFNHLHNEPLDRPLEHDLHCFDSLRQHIMCTADTTILTTTGHGDVGSNQTRQCRDWDRLREWATEHTACYRDWEPREGETRWGHCDGGDDGLPKGGLLE